MCVNTTGNEAILYSTICDYTPQVATKKAQKVEKKKAKKRNAVGEIEVCVKEKSYSAACNTVHDCTPQVASKKAKQLDKELKSLQSESCRQLQLDYFTSQVWPSFLAHKYNSNSWYYPFDTSIHHRICQLR